MIRVKDNLKVYLTKAFMAAQETGEIPAINIPEIILERPKQIEYGDLASNLALKISSLCHISPYKIANSLIKHLKVEDGFISKIDIAGPGFINFFINPITWIKVLPYIITKGLDFGRGIWGLGEKAIVELVSANPTGPLHVGHGRCAVIGDVLARLLIFSGFQVVSEYYINDIGNQMTILGNSILQRIREFQGDKSLFPSNYYRGNYIKKLAIDLLTTFDGIKLLSLPEQEIVAKISFWAKNKILSNIKSDLEKFGVEINSWISEKYLLDFRTTEKIFILLKGMKLLYVNEGALWFKSTAYGDEKDRVFRRSNGELTYFANDIAYHLKKYNRGFNLIVNVWGADHHGYVPRLKAAMSSLGQNPNKINVLLVQIVNLLNKGIPMPMSTRSGDFISLKQVINEVGRDSARFLFLSRRIEAHLDFDLELAKKNNMENPVFYIQYAYTRIKSILKKVNITNVYSSNLEYLNLSSLNLIDEVILARKLDEFPEVIEGATRNLEPHRIIYYLQEVAESFHSYYNTHRILIKNITLASVRLTLVQAIAVVLFNGLNLLGISAPEIM